MIDQDIIYEKTGIIQRCLKRIQQVTGLDSRKLDDIDVQDIFILNLLRAVQAAIDLAAHVIADDLQLSTSSLVIDTRNVYSNSQAVNAIRLGVGSPNR